MKSKITWSSSLAELVPQGARHVHAESLYRILTSVVCTDLTTFGLYLRPRSRFSHTDLLFG